MQRKLDKKYPCNDSEEYKKGSRAELIAQKNCSDDPSRWSTVSRDAFSPPKKSDVLSTEEKRRELVKKLLYISVSKEVYDELLANPPPEPTPPTEYVDNYCDSTFTPFIDRLEYNSKKHLTHPLYSGSVETYYRGQIENGTLKARSEIYNPQEPFRRTCFFTTPPDLAFREPTGGY